MVRIHKRAKRDIVAFYGVPGQYSSDSDLDERQSLADRAREKMSEREVALSGVVSEFQKVSKAEGKQVIMTPEGVWMDTKSYFITKAPLADEREFYRGIASFYKFKHPNGPLGPYNKEEFDRRFKEYAVSRAPYTVKSSFRELPWEVQDRLIRVAFQLPDAVEWRFPEPEERIFHRPADGFVPVWMEHLRSGWNPRWHLFFRHLCKYEYKCSPMQITPNAIKLMTWFLCACNKMGYQPTFKLFHILFQFKKSGEKPLYELRFRSKECGFGPDFLKPVMHQSSLKNWNREVLMLKGLDIHYMPYLVTDDKLVKTNFDAPGASGKFRDQLREFCECLGQQLTRDTFMQFDKLHEWGCKYNPD